MISPRRWAKALVRLLLLSAPIGLLVLAACRSAPAEFNLQYACLQRSLPPCLAAEDFANRVADRTDRRVQIEITTLRDLGIPDTDTLTRLKDGTLEMAEIYPEHFMGDGDRAVLDIPDLWGIYPDYGTQAQVTDAIRGEIEGIIAERSGGVVLAFQFYPSNYFFTKKPLRTAADMQELMTRSSNTLSYDLLAGMGAIPEDKTFHSVYTGLQSGKLDAAVSCSSCGANLK